ncbi:MAG TPA: hypothetical protein PKI01_11460 [Bacteroidales bacterium]|nr:hypothetical protein [Bacteroidales bacterium]
MKNLVKFILFLLIVFFALSCNRPENILNRNLGFKLPQKIKLKTFEDKWNKNASGDGYTLVIYEFDKSECEYLTNNCTSLKFFKLPILENLPDATIYKYISKQDSRGFYKIKIDNVDKRDYYITIVDFQTLQIIYYYVLN